MRLRRRSLRWLLLSLLALAARPVLAQNLLVNPGFDRDLSGWTLSTAFSTVPTPGVVEASAGWTSSDAGGNGSSGAAAMHALAFIRTAADVWLFQCVPVSEGVLVSFGARIQTTRQLGVQGQVFSSLYSSTDCSGTRLGAPGFAGSLPVDFLTETSSSGLWLPATSSILAPPGSRAALLQIGIWASGTSFYGTAYADVAFDNVFLSTAPTQTTSWLLPSAAWIHGAGGSYWTTQFTLSNPGPTDAAVTLKWLGHDVDGRGGRETAYLVRAGQIFIPDKNTWWVNHPEDYGAILITSSSSALAVQSEILTPSLGGTVGQALPALGAADFAGASPKTLAPIRENAAFRTNLVLANASEIPVVAHVELFDWGRLLGTRDVVLPPLGMTQINRVASVLGATSLETGRISVSTPTPGGLVAAYASIIDNTTNDPLTILPQDAHTDPPGPNLLANPGFDHDLSGWNASHSAVGYGAADAEWSGNDRKGPVAASGSAALGASASASPGAGSAVVSQCVGVVPGRTYGLNAWVSTSGWAVVGGIPSPQLRVEYFGTPDCSGSVSTSSTSRVRPFNSLWGSDGLWFVLFAPSSIAPSSARSALVVLGVGASAGVHGLGISATFDDVFFGEGDSSAVAFLPSAASVNGIGGSYWTTDLSLSYTGSDYASVYLEFFGNGTGGGSFVANVSPGETETVRDVLATLFQRSLSWGPLRITATSPGITISAETSTSATHGGTLGQALAAVATRDLIGATPKTIAPIRDDAFFRTNLVVSNATESPLTVHVDLFDAGGTLLGSRDVGLDSLAAAQIGGVGWSLAGTTVNPGRIAVSTPTAGGLVAAYASVIDNVTNDPRTILPR